MKRVTGIGGIFFKTRNTDKVNAWYARHLGITPDEDGSVAFKWREQEDPERTGYTIWAPFPHDTRYFGPGKSPYMINFRVADLDALMQQLRAEGVQVEEKIEESEYGRFGWITDLEGNRVELWEPPRNG